MFDTRTQACSPSSPLATLSWPHNVTIGGTEVERGRCLFIRNTVARNRERNERTLKGSVESSMATAIPAMGGGGRICSAVFPNWRTIPHCPGSTAEPETLSLLVQIRHAHTNTETRARAHTSERGREREKGVSRVAAIEGSSRYELNARLLAAKACWPLVEGEGKLRRRQRQLLTKKVT